MKNVLKIWLAAALLCVAGLGSANAKEASCPGIEAGAKAYNENDFERAVDEWRSCVDNGIQDADLYYNLGNAYFRSTKLGFAIFYYKSALRLRPNDPDIQHNLAYAQAMTKDKVEEDDEENPLLAGLFKAHHALSLKVQLFILLGLFWIIVLAAVGNKISVSEKARNVFMGTIFALTAIFCVIAASAGYKVFVAETEITGVVTAADADVTSAPSDKSQTLNTLSEGTSFEVLSEQGQFVEIRLGEKVKGFVKHSDVGIIK
ncbi:MAG: tetratricopeptide repeat protein [Fibrobacter sp.]|nr:tetratricopeptide repeat protein [Fibrobacter sp.]